MPDKVTLRTCGKQYSAARRVNRSPRSFDALDRLRQSVQWLRSIPGVVFDRETRDTRLDAKPDICRDAFRFVRISGFEVRIDRYIDGADNLRDVCQHTVSRHSPRGVRQTARERKAGTR